MTFEAALATVRARAPEFRPRIGFILGSGLGGLADAVEGVALDYTELPGFPHAGVSRRPGTPCNADRSHRAPRRVEPCYRLGNGRHP